MELNLADTKKWIELFVKKVEANTSELNELDTAIGDGDHGSNMARGMAAVTDALSKKEPADLAELYKTVAFAMIQKVGGASGPLYGTAFMEMAKVGDGEVSALLPAALAGIKKRGKAETGEKTMVDVWAPIAEKTDFTAADVDKAVEATKDMVATKGRASYVGERSVGHIDPGAMSSGYLLKALLEVEE